MRPHRKKKPLLRDFWTCALGNAKHQRLAWSVDIGIQDAHPGALGLQCEGEVHSGGRFPHPPLPGSDGDEVFHAAQGLPILRAAMGHDSPPKIDRDAVHTRQAMNRLGQAVDHLGGQGGGWIPQAHAQRQDTSTQIRWIQVAQIHQRALEHWVVDRGERAGNQLQRIGHGRGSR